MPLQSYVYSISKLIRKRGVVTMQLIRNGSRLTDHYFNSKIDITSMCLCFAALGRDEKVIFEFHGVIGYAWSNSYLRAFGEKLIYTHAQFEVCQMGTDTHCLNINKAESKVFCTIRTSSANTKRRVGVIHLLGEI